MATARLRSEMYNSSANNCWIWSTLSRVCEEVMGESQPGEFERHSNIDRRDPKVVRDAWLSLQRIPALPRARRLFAPLRP